MRRNILDRVKFACWVHVPGDISYPGLETDFERTTIFNGADGNDYIAAEYNGAGLMPTDKTFDEYFDLSYRSQLVTEITTEIKEKQRTALIELEGTNGELQRKAIEYINTDSSFAKYDDLMKKKGYVRSFGNSEEIVILSLSAEDLNSYSFVIDLSLAPDIKGRRITVGAFQLRFTPEENQRIEAAMKESAELNLNYQSLLSRTHVYLDSPEIVGAITIMAATELLEPAPIDPSYSSRSEEIMRDGTEEEIFRVIAAA